MTCFVADPSRPHLGGNMKGGDPACWCPEVWRWLVDRYKPKAMLDVGCGTGAALGWFKDDGVFSLGIEGLRENANGCDSPVLVHDLTTGLIELANVDLVWCCEVVEHVEAAYLDNLLSALCCGRLLAMTHATPGQGGYHHVNEQSSEFWIERMRSRGFKYNPDATMEARGLIADRKNYFAMSGLVFER